MNRREFINKSANVAMGAALATGNSTAFCGQDEFKSKIEAKPLPTSVAGIRLVDSEISKAATALARSVYQPYLFNHAVRTFLFGSLIGRALSLKFDDELLYLACILH